LSKIDFKHRRVVGAPSFESSHAHIHCASVDPDPHIDDASRSTFPDLLKRVKELQESGRLPKRPTPEQVKDWASAQATLGEYEARARQIVDELTAEAQKLGLGY
jgi:hypothetical protein